MQRLIRILVVFFKPSLPKLIFGAEWAGWLLLLVVRGSVLTPHQLLVAFVVLLLFYSLGCALVAWSRRARRIAGGRGLAFLVLLLLALDQSGKAAAGYLLEQNSGTRLVEGWLEFVNVPNLAGSWCAPVSTKPALVLAVFPVPALAIIGYRYYVSTRRRSLWADLSLVGLTAGPLSWLVDMFLRGYVLDFVAVPGLITVNLSDLYTLLVWSVLVELLDRPETSLRWQGWRAEYDEIRTLIRDVAAFAAKDVRSWLPSGCAREGD
jgi:lipoprotein signal peptidase